MHPIRLNELSTEKLRSAVEKSPLIMIPLGTTEWHAGHLPLGVDTLLSQAVCDEVSARTGCVVAPALSCGISRNLNPQKGYFGTVNTITVQTLTDLLVDLGIGYAAMGFRTAVVYSGHGEGEHFEAVNKAVEKSKEIEMIQLSVEDLLTGKIVELDEAEKTWPFAPDHAAEWETSMMMHFYPELVEMDRAPESIELDMPGIPAYIRRRYPKRASKAYGAQLAQAVIEGGVRRINDLLLV